MTTLLVASTFLGKLRAAEPDLQELERRLAGAAGAERVDLLIEISETHYAQGQTQRSLEVAREAERLARASDYPTGLALALYKSSRTSAKLSRVEPALDSINEAIDLYESLNDAHGVAKSSSIRCMLLQQTGEFSRALDNCFRAVKFFESVGLWEDLAVAQNILGGAFMRLDRPEEALLHYTRALELAELAKAKSVVGMVLNNLAAIHDSLGNTAGALESLRRSLELKKEVGDTLGQAHRLSNIGNLCSRIGDEECAIDSYRRALAKAKEADHPRGIAVALIGLSKAHSRRGEYREGIEKAEEAARLVVESGEVFEGIAIYRMLSDAYKEAGRHQDALAALNRSAELQSEFFNEQTQQTVAEMEARFDSERKEQEIEILKERQIVADLKIERQSSERRMAVAGFTLFLLVLVLLFNRYRLSSRSELMKEAVMLERKTNERLREIDRLKDEFLAKTSHELRTPLHGITGLVGSMIDGAAGPLPPAVEKDLSLVVSSSQRLTDLVNDLLDLSKLEHHSVELELRPVDLRSLAEVVLSLLRPLVAGTNVELRNSIEPDLPAALGDEGRLRQVLDNLVGNAIRFTESGHIEVKATHVGDRVLLQVLDTGIGIVEVDQARIFLPFEQGSTSAEGKPGRTGLGLAVARELVELHGGELTVESKPGEGSTFTVALSIADGKAAPSPPRKKDAASGAPLTARREGLTSPDGNREAQTLDPDLPAARPPVFGSERPPHILVVDDEEVNRKILANYLSLEGYEYTLADSGERAFQLLEEKAYDMVLLDVMMPKLSGYEVCRRLRLEYPIAELPVLFLTAKTQESDVATGMAFGANDYLTKPVTRERLLNRMRPHLEVLDVHRHLERRVEEKMAQVSVLSGLLPICCGCKSIRDDDGYWSQLETYLHDHSEAKFSHGFCPECYEEYYGELLETAPREAPVNELPI